MKEVKGKEYYVDRYYIGEFKNDYRYGKEIEYYKNGKIKYKGDFVEGCYEGDEKYIYYDYYEYYKGELLYDDGDYYIGKFKEGRKNGKGIEYYVDGKIR